MLAGSVIGLATRAHPERSPSGFGLTASSLPVMPLMGRRKRRTGSALRSPLVLADAAETTSGRHGPGRARPVRGVRLVVGRPAAPLAVAWFAVREGRDAWHGELACDD